MIKSLSLALIILNFSFSQVKQDPSSPDETKVGLMMGVNVLYGNYTFGIKDGAENGHTNGYSISLNIFNEARRTISIVLGSLSITQKSSRFCEGAGIIDKNFNENKYYMTADLEVFSTNYIKANLGISLINSNKESTVCSNEIYFKSPLLNYNVGLGLIEKIYINFGFNTDYEINKNFGKNYGLYNSGVNFIINKRDYLILNYYWNRDSYYDYYYSGWLFESHINFFENYGVKTKVYYSMDIEGVSFTLGLTYLL